MQFLSALWRAWMKFGFFIGNIVSGIVLGVFYFTVFGLVAVLFRLFGTNALSRHADQSNWVENKTPRTALADFANES